jgi:hypothetical protein
VGGRQLQLDSAVLHTERRAGEPSIATIGGDVADSVVASIVGGVADSVAKSIGDDGFILWFEFKPLANHRPWF